ncbi:LamG-like jellyroll fold domain-containing protein [Anseongella ginsenosidimutans]|nr:LamG-like jellyroll fold domain-containing protein [Anseongella ginsenosidimutans]
MIEKRKAVLLFIVGAFIAGILLAPSPSSAQAYWNNDYFQLAFQPSGGYIQITIRNKYDDNAFVDNGDDRSGNTSLSFSTETFGENEFEQIALFDIFDEDPDSFQMSSASITDAARNMFYRIEYETDETTGRYIIRLYINNEGKHIKRLRFHINKWNRKGDGGPQDQHDINVIKNVDIPSLGNFTYTTSFREDGKVKLDWNSNDNSVTDRSTTILYAEGGEELDRSAAGANSGSFLIDQQNSTNTYYLGQGAYSNHVTERTEDIIIPAFTHPDSIYASYNAVTNQAEITWTIPKAIGEEVESSGFKLQRATKPDFSDAIKIDLTPFQNMEYHPDSTSYTFSEAPYADVYYRVTRDLDPDWGWGMAKTVHFTAGHAAISGNSGVNLSLDNTGRRAVLQWDTTGIWAPEAVFIITRIDLDNGNNTNFNLEEKDYFRGEFTDSLLIPCHRYSYKLQVKPPARLGFLTNEPYQTSNTILPVEIGTISGLIVSKGYFNNRVELQWKSEGGFDNYIIKRKVYGSSGAFTQLSSVAGGLSSADIVATDQGTSPGIYYEYMVVGVVNCSNTLRYSQDTLYAIGFRAPTGNVYGRVTYENGQAVTGVSVRLESDAGEGRGQSIYLDGSPGSYLRLDSLQVPFSDSAFTIEAWIRPEDEAPENQVIFSREGQYELGFGANGDLYFSANDQLVSAGYTNSNQSFIHVTGVRHRDTLRILLNDSLLAEAIQPLQPPAEPAKEVYIGKNAAGSNFKGYIDEMRAWNAALNRQQVARQHTQVLTGGENGLVAYWRFDETISDQFYDLSHREEQYNRNDGVMNPGAVQRSATVPTAEQLSLKAFTDSTGNYMITGVPYFGNGSTYTIVPLLGTHQFDPVSEKRLISADDPSFTVNFVDKSSFAVSGYVYYRDGTVPVEGVQFQIDGKYAQKANGELLQTDTEGKFTIFVPVGTHEVKAVKNNHVFVNGGKITNRFGEDLNYQGPVSERILYDSTAIRFIGRVAGGALQESFPLGHSLSENNLGRELSITMSLPSGTKYELHSGSRDTTVWVNHLSPGGQDDPSKVHRTRIVYHQNKIVIYPDSLTGEFQADLLPEKFIVDNVQVTGWGNLLEGQGVAVDFTNKFLKQYSVLEYSDHTDSVAYNDSYQFIKRVNPSVSITQQNAAGADLAYFGHDVYETVGAEGEEISIPVIDPAKTERDMYLFRYPVFRQGREYDLRINAFEEYPFYESVKPDGTPVVAMQDGEAVIDKVPTRDGQVSILNTIRNQATSADTLSLDSAGVGYYQFTAGNPAITAPGLKSLSVTVRFGEATDLTWSWLGQPKLEGFVMGAQMTGTDFVTAGPDKLLTVLRDPPGSRSYSFLEEGSTFKESSTYSNSVDQEGNIEAKVLFSQKVVTFFGLGGGKIEEIQSSENSVGAGATHEEHYSYSNGKESATSLTNRFQTSDAPTFVGAPGDVYVGYSTNITYGQTRNVIIIERDDLKAADSVLSDPGAASSYLVVMREGINFGEQFGTLFAYPQQHIIKVLIPNLTHIRNTLLLPVGTENGQAIANTSGEPVYVSKLAADDLRFGKTNGDTEAFGSSAEDDLFNDGESYKIYFPEGSEYATDTIMVLNQYIRDWEQRIEDNEKQKLEAPVFQNYSFHAGSPVSYSEQFSETEAKSHSFNIILSAKILSETFFEILGQGLKLKIDESIGTSNGGNFETVTGTERTTGFVMASDGTDDYISVDVNKPEEGGFVFRTLGGATACPYEGEEVTQYYNKGTVINQATQRIEVPVLTVDNPVVNDVPATQKASYTLKIKNESEARLPTTLMLSYLDTDSIKGATISVDGLPIGGTGRPIPVQYGETVTKVITLTKGPDAMDYNNIPIILKSACQYDPTGYQETIADTVLISAHFVPACSNVNIKSPTNQWILNTDAPLNGENKRYLPLIIDQFDLSNSLFDRIELQYKPSSSARWITVMKFYGDSSKYKEAQGEKLFITNAQELLYNLEMDDASFNDQGYDIRAVSICELGPDDYINTPSNVISGLKDTYSPRLFGSAQPAGGVLGVSDEIRLNFNEPIAAGLLTNPDFQVRGIRNGAISDHSVSAALDGDGDYLETEFDKNLSGKDITMELWALPEAEGRGGTLISHGAASGSLELALTSDNYLQVIAGTQTLKSEQPLAISPGEWAHLALVYHAADATVSAYYNFTEVIHAAPVPAYAGNGPFQLGRSISGAGNFFHGKMHETRIWTEALSAVRLQTNSLKRLSGAENGLLAYYPMNEGKGELAIDKAHGSHARLRGEWSTPAGRSIDFNGNGHLKISTGAIPVTNEMDYTLELWFKGEAGQQEAALAANGRGEGNELGGSYDAFFLGFEGGQLTFRNNGLRMQAPGNYLDGHWHHVALAVNRNSGTAQFFVDGELKTFFDARDLGGLVAPFVYLGARGWYEANDPATLHFDRHFRGNIDEFRIWNTYLGQPLIDINNNVRLRGNELGLLAYYPFETYFEFQNNLEMGYSLEDQRVPSDPAATIPAAVANNAAESADKAPIKDRGPVENLQFDFVVNNDALIINLLEPRQAVDKTIVTFQVKDVRDLNGNSLKSPVTWSAYINRNQLSWSDPEFILSQELYAPLEFESYVINSGGSVEHFSLDNLPSWLEASPAAGTVAPQGRARVIFKVREGLNIGSYDQIVYMRNDNDESAALPITLTVKGEEPPWEVNPADFKYSMTVYGKLQVKEAFSADENDLLAAFRDGVCVGVTRNSYNQKNDLWYALLTIYHNEPEGGELEFRIWDASTGKTYLASPSEPVSFRNDAIAGTSRAPVIFRGEEIFFQELKLQKGWNWISFNLSGPAMDNVATTLSNGQWQPGDIVKNEELGFHQYSESDGWVGYMERFNNTSLFMIRASAAQSLSIAGIPVNPSETPIPIKGNRWNYISYLPQVSLPLEEALAGYEASEEDVIKSQTGFAMYDPQNGWMGNLTHLEPGKGYMLYRKAINDETLVYSSLGGSFISHAGDASALPLLKNAARPGNFPVASAQMQTPVDNNFRYEGNMTVVAVIDDSFQLQPEDVVLAYMENELSGKARATDLPGMKRFFLTISGEEQRPLHFEVVRAGQVVLRSGTVLSYRSNSQAGTLDNPLVIRNENEAGKITAFPNPFGNRVNVRVELKENQKQESLLLQLSVYDTNGNIIMEGPKERVISNIHFFAWDGRNSRGENCPAGVYFIRVTINGMPLVQKVIKIDTLK